jgi:RimJ/RimL family protein N-acetyltransferase
VKNLKLVPYSRKFLTLSWLWLNDPEIKVLTQTGEISKITQNTWFETLSHREDYLIWGLEFDKICIGACGLKQIKGNQAEYWGYIGNKNYWGKGFGKEMIKCVELIAKEMGLKRLVLNVLKINIRAVRLYEKLGFQVYEEQEKCYLMQKKIYDTVS